MAKQSGFLKRQKEERKTHDRILQDATRQTFVQYMTDTLLFTLNDPEVMGKDVFGYARLKKILDAWGAKYDLYFDALTLKDEADYFRQKMDDTLRRIVLHLEKPPQIHISHGHIYRLPLGQIHHILQHPQAFRTFLNQIPHQNQQIVPSVIHLPQ